MASDPPLGGTRTPGYRIGQGQSATVSSEHCPIVGAFPPILDEDGLFQLYGFELRG
jgi:hypothetical protein